MISGCRSSYTRKGLSRHVNSSIKRTFLSFSLNLLAHALHKTRDYSLSGRASMICLNIHPGMHQSPLCPQASSSSSCSFPGSWMGNGWVLGSCWAGWRWLLVSKARTGSCRTLLQSFTLTFLCLSLLPVLPNLPLQRDVSHGAPLAEV